MPDWFKDYVRAIVARKEAEGARAIGAVRCVGLHAQGFAEDGTPMFEGWTRCDVCGAAL